MNTVIAFIGGSFLSGVVLAIVFGALHLEAEHEAYWQGYLQCAEDAKKVQQEERSSNEADI